MADDIKHGSLGNHIFYIIREKILNEEYIAGQKLSEVELSNEMNISRTPIREALKQLELEGLVKSIPNKGVYVLGFSESDIDDMLEIRFSLEGIAIQFAIERITYEQLELLRKTCELMDGCVLSNNQDTFDDLNILFHETIYKGTQSLYFEKILKDINYYIHVTSKQSIRQPKRLASAAIEHREIFDALVEKDKEKAKEKVQNHIRKTQMIIKNYYQNK